MRNPLRKRPPYPMGAGAAWDGRPLPVNSDDYPAAQPSRVATALAHAGVPLGTATPEGVEPVPVRLPGRRRRERPPVDVTDPYQKQNPDRARRRVHRTSLALALVLVGSLVFSVAAVVVSFTRGAPAASDVTAAAGTGPAGFAELYVRTWLAAGQDNADTLKPFYPGPVDLASRPVAVMFATAATTVDVQHRTGGPWDVTVAAQVAEQTGDPENPVTRDTGLHYYTVRVVDQPDGGRVAAGLPAETAAPVAAKDPDTLVTATSPPTAEFPRDQTIVRFLQAMLTPPPAGSTAQAEVDRLVAPGSGIRAVAPSPYKTVEVVQIGSVSADGDAQTEQVRAVVRATTHGGNTLTLDYNLRVGRRDDRVEIQRVAAGPAIKISQGG